MLNMTIVREFCEEEFDCKPNMEQSGADEWNERYIFDTDYGEHATTQDLESFSVFNVLFRVLSSSN